MFVLNKFRGLIIIVGLLAFSLVIGTTGYMLIEEYNFNEGLFMSIITLFSMGFTEVHLLSDNGLIFTTFYIVLNIVICIIIAIIIWYLNRSIFMNKLLDPDYRK